MIKSWRTFSSHVVEDEARTIIAAYNAVVGRDIEQSAISLVGGVERSLISAVLMSPPEWCPFVWPQVADPTEHDLHRLALLRLQALFDFNPDIPGDTALELWDGLNRKFPGLKWDKNDESEPVRLKRLQVQARIWSNGSSDWNYIFPERGAFPPLGQDTWSNLDAFIRVLVRIDLRSRLALGTAQ